MRLLWYRLHWKYIKSESWSSKSNLKLTLHWNTKEHSFKPTPEPMFLNVLLFLRHWFTRVLLPSSHLPNEDGIMWDCTFTRRDPMAIWSSPFYSKLYQKSCTSFKLHLHCGWTWQHKNRSSHFICLGVLSVIWNEKAVSFPTLHCSKWDPNE